jgi:hypothetical protein
MNYAIIDETGLVVNVVLWDGKTPWVPPAGYIALPLLEASIGWTFANGQFIAPSDTETVE